jgi:hypothetical protein
LAQTTTTQTIVKHIANKCDHVPQNIKDIISNLANQSSEDERPTYATTKSTAGYSRKTFFGRIWKKLHPAEPSDDDDMSNASTQRTFFPTKEAKPSPLRRSIVPGHPTEVGFSPIIDKSFDADKGDLLDSHDLYDDMDRRIIIRGTFLEIEAGNKRMRSIDFSPVKRFKMA